MSPRHFTLWLFLFLILSGTVRAERDTAYHIVPLRSSMLPVPLEGRWRYHPGDDPAYASPRIDDAKWMTSPSQFYTGGYNRRPLAFHQVGWFRLYVLVDSALSGRPLAITLAHDDDARADLYVDGRLLHPAVATGKSGQPGRYFKPPRIFTPARSGLHLIAVRFEDADIRAARKQRRGGFSATIHTAPEAMEAFGNRVTTFISGFVLFFTFFFSFGLLHLILFLYYRAERSNAFFALFCLTTGGFLLCIYLSLVLGNNTVKAFVDTYNVFMLAAVFATLSAFINQMFGRGRMRFLITLLMALSIVVTFFTDRAAHSVLPLLMAVVCIEAVVLILRAIFRRVPGAHIIGIGVLFFALVVIVFAVLISTEPLFPSPVQDNTLIVFIFCSFILAVISMPLSMSAYLAWNYASVSRGLGKQLAEVERLSDAAREHEAEKQRLLELRADDLEREVGIRTEELRRQRDKSDELLENILPAEVAEELKEKGSAAARLYDNVTVLFTDFSDFTQRAETLSPAELVGELNECFSAFDVIITRRGLEKIKTVGDAYIAVSGLPAANPRHAQDVVAAALEVRDFMSARKEAHPASFGIRLGVHSGSLVAGIVGVKKFAYDIWGDTVNTAARMEQHSEPGQVNISAATFALVKDEFDCTYRGELEAKHKGKMGMHFVNSPIS